MEKEKGNSAQPPTSPLTEEEAQRCIQQFHSGYMQLFEEMSPAKREYMRRLVAATLTSESLAGYTNLCESLWAVDYEHKRVDPYTFFTHPDYVGHFRTEIYDAWWPHLLEMCDPKNNIYEVILTGSLGIGKTTVANGLFLSYLLHKLLCLRNPARFFGLGHKSKIVLGIYSLSLRSAEDAGFYVLRDQILSESPFFNVLYRRSPVGADEIKFPKNIIVRTGSNALHAAGKNLFACCIDEMNLMAQGESTANKAFDLANKVSRRLENRFLQRGGEMPGACIFLGSAATESSFIERRIKRVQGLPGHYVVRGAIWDFVRLDDEGKSKYSGKKFRVQIGNRMADSRVLDFVEKDGAEWKVEEVEEPDLDCRVIEVPVEHFGSFQIDCDGSIKDLAGISVRATMKLFPNPERVMACVDRNRKNPFPSSIIKAYLGGGIELKDLLEREACCRILGGKYVPKRHPEAPRYIHVDLAKNGCRAGVGMVHPSTHFIAVEDEGDDEDIGTYDVHKKVEADFVIGIESGEKGEPIDYANIRRLIYHIRRLGFWIRMVTFDSYQSEDSIQRLSEAGLRAEIQSVDRDHVPYTITRNTINAKRHSFPHVDVLYTELVDLDFDQMTMKIDHPPGGSKDLADGLAGATYRCLVDKIRPRDYAHKVSAYTKKTEAFNRYLAELQQIEEIFQR